MIRRLAATTLVATLLASCANPPPISTNPIQSVVNATGLGSGNDVITQGIANAQYNFNQALALGILPASDPAPGCLNSVATLLGIGGTAPAQFTPKITDLISAGSVGYIYLQQLKAATGGTLQVSPQCTQLIGQIIIDSTKMNLKLGSGALGAGVLTGGIPLPIPTLGEAAPTADANPSLDGK